MLTAKEEESLQLHCQKILYKKTNSKSSTIEFGAEWAHSVAICPFCTNRNRLKYEWEGNKQKKGARPYEHVARVKDIIVSFARYTQYSAESFLLLYKYAKIFKENYTDSKKTHINIRL